MFFLEEGENSQSYIELKACIHVANLDIQLSTYWYDPSWNKPIFKLSWLLR